MRPDRVVLVKPAVDNDSGFGHVTEQASIEARRSKNRFEALVIGVLPRAARIDVMRVDVLLPEPVPHIPRDQPGLSGSLAA